MQRRIEKKFIVNSISYNNIIYLIENRIGFKEIFNERQVNSIYLDDAKLSSFYANIDGNFYKQKWRLRWYGKTFGENKELNLEQKSKLGMIQFKKNEIISKSIINENMNLNSFYENLPPKIKNLLIVSFIRYTRRYFANKDMSIRITVDKNIEYSNINRKKIFRINNPYCDNRIILEMKSSINEEEALNNICQKLPFRVSKNSKYINSIISSHH